VIPPVAEQATTWPAEQQMIPFNVQLSSWEDKAVCHLATRVGILKQNAKSWYSEIPGFEVRRNSKNFFWPTIFLKHWFMPALYMLFILPG
jgi:hypothetical protein